jgi:hypothetical protein
MIGLETPQAFDFASREKKRVRSIMITIIPLNYQCNDLVIHEELIQKKLVID